MNCTHCQASTGIVLQTNLGHGYDAVEMQIQQYFSKGESYERERGSERERDRDRDRQRERERERERVCACVQGES